MKGSSLLLCATAALTLAQQPRDGQRPTVRVGTAVVSGAVLSTDTPVRPIRRALVTLDHPDLPFDLTAVTDDEGRFAIERVPAGRYTARAAKEAYLTTTHGAVRPGRPGRHIAIGVGERREIVFSLQRGAVLTGTIIDGQGQPVPGVTVMAHRSGFNGTTGDRMLTAPEIAQSNDLGEYRIFGLPAGEYVVSALPSTQGWDLPGASSLLSGPLRTLSPGEIRQALSEVATSPVGPARVPGMPRPPPVLPRSELPPPRTVAYAPVFYPGTTSSADAWRIRLDVGEERGGLDLQLEVAATASVSGTVFGMDTRGTVVTLTTANVRGDAWTGDRYTRTATPDVAGNFHFAGVPPGMYEVSARFLVAYLKGGQFAGGSAAFATTTVAVDGEDVTGVGLALQPGFSISGQLVFDGERPPDAATLASMRASVPLLPALGGRGHMAPLQVMADGRFVAHAIVPGPYRPSPSLQGIRTPIGGWWLQSIVVEGRELLDAPIELTRPVEDAVVTLADRASEFSGSVTDPAGDPLTSHHVIIFSADPAHWFPLSRRVAAIRLAATGHYSVRNLPPGDYFVVVDDDVEPGEWFDPGYLGRMAGRAVRVAVGPHEKVLRNLMVPDR
jgi:hypothetical protein